MKRLLIKNTACCLAMIMLLVGFVPRVEAGFSPTAYGSSDYDRRGDLSRIQTVLETKMVGDRLEKLGFSSEEIQSRLNEMSSDQLHQLALSLDDMKTGGDGLGLIIAILVIAIVVVLALQLTGHKVIVK